MLQYVSDNDKTRVLSSLRIWTMSLFIFSLRNPRKDYSTSIHVSLSGALLLLNTTFLLTEWGATVKPDWICMFVAALMHYSLLCCFTWMAIEALHLYLLLLKVYNTYYKRYLLKLSLAGWGECCKSTFAVFTVLLSRLCVWQGKKYPQVFVFVFVGLKAFHERIHALVIQS